MTLSREQVPLCACEQFYDSHPPDCPVVLYVAALLQSAETVAKERDEARRRWDDLKAWVHTDDEDERLNQTLNGIYAVRNKMRALEQS